MKKLKDNKYFQIGIMALVVIASGIILGFVLFKIKDILSLIGKRIALFTPFIIGFIFAYLLNPIVKFFKKSVFSKFVKSDKKSNYLSILVTCILFIAVLSVLFGTIIPDLLKSVETLAVNLPNYFEEIKNYLLKKFTSVESKNAVVNNYEAINTYINNLVNSSILPKVELWLTTLSNGVIGALRTVVNIVLGFVVSIYFLADKDNFIAGIKRIVYSIFSVDRANKIIENARHTDDIFSNFIIGKLLDSLIIGLITFIFLAIFGYPYALLIAVIIGVTNLIPSFGPFIGAIPSALLILMDNPTKCLIFVLFIIVLQQIDGYLLGPKLCGSKTGLKSFWVLASIIFFGKLFNIIGMLIGVPIFALIYGYLDNILANKLKRKELPVKNEAYKNLDRINSKTNKVVEKKKND